ncbi:MAG: AAA family ATPase [Deltaproteobacteria bacterium]|nr:AAA family ATPase [Deltaproteobacteria bacterium]
MRIDNLKLQNFRCFHDLDLDFAKPINFIFGPNASGKSTIAEAMEMALTGRCNGFNPNWRDRAALARHGSDTFKIQLDMDIDGDRSPLGSAPGHPQAGAQGLLTQAGCHCQDAPCKQGGPGSPVRYRAFLIPPSR